MIAATTAALLATGAKWSPEQRMPSAIGVEQVPAPAGADLAFALTGVGRRVPNSSNVPSSPSPTTPDAQSPSSRG